MKLHCTQKLFKFGENNKLKVPNYHQSKRPTVGVDVLHDHCDIKTKQNKDLILHSVPFSEPGCNITEPKVNVLEPAEDECRNKTLVCLAEGFYPDHITVSWQVDGKNRTRGVATDSKAERVRDHYRISSRLTVPATSWFTAGRRFTCIVTFYNGKTYIPKPAEALGIQGTIESRQSENVLFV